VPLATVLALATLLAGCVGLARSQHGRGTKDASRQAVLILEPAHIGSRFAQGAVGLSTETDELATRDLSASHRPLVALMRLLGPAVLRVGGNSLDRSWWTSRQEDPPAWATSVVTPDSLIRLRNLLAATGWRAILGVDLGHFDPTRAANEVHTAQQILGSRLLGIEVGNEPNDYGGALVKLRPSSYSASSYLDELAAYRKAMQSAAPGIRLFGPDLASSVSQAWLLPIASSPNTSFIAITQHYYPTTYSFPKGPCEGTPVPAATELLSPEIRERENTALQTIIEAGDLAHKEARITETNDTASCDASGGPATSPVFASALWSLDWVLRAASSGVSGLNFHGYFGRCRPETFAPICAPDETAEIRGIVIARPEYYGLLAARQLEGGRFLSVRVAAKSSSQDFTAYATLHQNGAISLAIDNFSLHGISVVRLKVPGYRRAEVEPLNGPSISATRVAFGRASFNIAGKLQPIKGRLPGTHGAFRVVLAQASAVIVTLFRS